MSNEIINTDQAPAALGTYSQAVKAGQTVYLSGQIGLAPGASHLVSDDVGEQTARAFTNLQAVAQAAGSDLTQLVKLTIFITDFADFAVINQVMSEHIAAPYPARATVGVASLPLNAKVEIEGILVIENVV